MSGRGGESGDDRREHNDARHRYASERRKSRAAMAPSKIAPIAIGSSRPRPPPPSTVSAAAFPMAGAPPLGTVASDRLAPLGCPLPTAVERFSAARLGAVATTRPATA